MQRTFILREQSHLTDLDAFLAKNWEECALIGKPLAVDVGEEHRKRSNQANAYYWAILHQISEPGGNSQAWVGGKCHTADVWHEFFKRTLLGVIDLPCGSVMGMSTATLSKAEFAQYVTNVEVYVAENLGIVLESPLEPVGRP